MRVVGVDLAGNEYAHPPEKFEAAFTAAHEVGAFWWCCLASGVWRLASGVWCLVRGPPSPPRTRCGEGAERSGERRGSPTLFNGSLTAL